MKVTFSLNSECEKLIPDVEYLVAANHAEHHFLWMENSIGAREHFGATLGSMEHKRQDWDERSRIGGMQEIGIVDDRPITIELNFQKIDGKQVCFYHGCSALVDYYMIKDYIRKTFPGVRETNSTNYSPAK